MARLRVQQVVAQGKNKVAAVAQRGWAKPELETADAGPAGARLLEVAEVGATVAQGTGGGGWCRQLL